MTYHDVYLRTPSEAAMIKAYPWLRTEGDELVWWSPTPDIALDVIGRRVQPAQLDEHGNETAPAVLDKRFYLNVRCTAEHVDQFTEHRVYPETPDRVWA